MITSSLPICDESEILNFYKFVRDVCFREKYDKFKTLLDAIVAAYKQMAEQYYKDVPDELIYYSGSIEFNMDRDRFFWIPLEEKLPQIPGLFGEIGNSIKIDRISYNEIKNHVGAWNDKALPVIKNNFSEFYRYCTSLPEFIRKPKDCLNNGGFDSRLHFVFDLEKKCYVLMYYNYTYHSHQEEVFVCENEDIVQAWVNDYCEKKFEEINRILDSQIGKEFLSDLPAAEEPVCEKVIENTEEFSTKEPESPCDQESESIEEEPDSEKPNENGDVLSILDDLKNLCSNTEASKKNNSVQLYLDFANEEAV